MSRCEVFAVQLCDPVMDLVIMRCAKAAPISVEGMAYGELGVAAIVVLGEVLGL